RLQQVFWDDLLTLIRSRGNLVLRGILPRGRRWRRKEQRHHERCQVNRLHGLFLVYDLFPRAPRAPHFASWTGNSRMRARRPAKILDRLAVVFLRLIPRRITVDASRPLGAIGLETGQHLEHELAEAARANAGPAISGCESGILATKYARRMQ